MSTFPSSGVPLDSPPDVPSGVPTGVPSGPPSSTTASLGAPSPATHPGPQPPPLRIGNFSGFYGDRFDALDEMLTGGALDVLTGDYLAELTMLILARDRLRDPALGYAKTFLGQLERCLGTAMERGVRIVTNAGGVNPAGLADRVRALADRLGIPARVAHVTGDDLTGTGTGTDPTATGKGPGTGKGPPGTGNGPPGAGEHLPGTGADRTVHPDWGEGVLAAHAYLGGHGIAACLRAGADIVVTGRVTDAALVSGPATAHFGWRLDEPEAYDRLAGAVVAGHILECGAQATGGNYAFFAAHGQARARRPGFPLAEVHQDGSCVITKHSGTGGFVTTGTVTAQLLYETAGARYAGPDVTARLDTVRLTQQGPDRVRVDGVRGEPPPPTLKVGLNRLGGWRGEVVFVLTGLDIDAKAALVRTQMEDALAARRPADLRWELARTDRPDADTEETASALLRLVARDPQEARVGRALGAAAVELALASYPGFHVTAPPGKGTPYGVFETACLAQGAVRHVAVLPDGRQEPIAAPERTAELRPVPDPPTPATQPHSTLPPATPPPATPPPAASPHAGTPTVRAPLGRLVGARSGDKGGSATLGVWVRQDDVLRTGAVDSARTERVWRWLVHTLTVDRLRALLPECAGLTVVRHVLPDLRALSFVVEGLLGAGAAARHRFDPQAKALGEWLRARHADIPRELLDPPRDAPNAPQEPAPREPAPQEPMAREPTHLPRRPAPRGPTPRDPAPKEPADRPKEPS